MAVEWSETVLGEVCELRAGSVFPPALQGKSAGKYPFAKVSDMNLAANAVCIHDANNWVDDSALSQLKAKPFPPGTTVFAKIGEALRANRLRFVVRPTIIDNNMMGAVPVADRVDPRYLFYALSQFDFSEVAVGTALPYLTVGGLSKLELSLPPIREQRAIAHILGTLDDKIELNRRMSETLEAMARALFKSWFDRLARPRVRVQDLVSAGVLQIGDGYRAKNSELGGPGLPFIRAGNLDNGFDTAGADILRHESVLRAGSKVSRRGDIAFTSKGTVGRFARVHESIPPFVYSPQVCFWRSLRPDLLEPSVLFLWMKSTDLRSQIEGVAGQTDMAPYVSLRDQLAMEVPSFPTSQHRLARCLDSLLARQAIAAVESQGLARLRDSLLPMLLSGALQVTKTQLSEIRGRA